MDLRDKFYRLSMIFGILCSANETGNELSINDLSEKLGIPKHLIRADIKSLVKHRGINMEFSDEDIEDIDELTDDDAIALYAEDFFETMLPLTPIQYSVVYPYFSLKDRSLYTPVVSMKSTIKGYSEDVINNLKTIFDVIHNNESGGQQGIKYKYGQPVRIMSGIPVDVRYENDGFNRAFCIFRTGAFARVDRMRDIEQIDGTELAKQKVLFNDDYDVLWGLPSGNDEPVNVRLRIIAGTRNLLDKFKADTKNRKYGSGLIEAGTAINHGEEVPVYEYTDTVSGLNDFKLWIRKYGSNIEVLEPEWLRKEISERAALTVEQYKQNRFLDL